MKICTDIIKHKEKIISSIKRFGYSPEHNYYHYLYKQTPFKQCIFFDFGQGRGVLTVLNKKNNFWHVTNGIFAFPDEMPNIFLKLAACAFSKKNAKKIVVEVEESIASRIIEAIKLSPLKANVNYALYWPIYNVQEWDEKLSGAKWKKIRNIRNRFYSNYKISVEDPRRIDKNKLRSILTSWLRRRHPRDKVEHSYYGNIIENRFMGFEIARAISINGEVCSISAGWKIPNSDVFYLGVGIFNYGYKDIGDFVNLEDLLFLKKMGYEKVDLGGSDKAILNFKMKFKPEKIYKTCIFSVSRKK